MINEQQQGQIETLIETIEEDLVENVITTTDGDALLSNNIRRVLTHFANTLSFILTGERLFYGSNRNNHQREENQKM